MQEERTRLLQVLREKSLKLGQFVLTSGQRSHYYLDGKQTTLDPEGAYLTARLMLHELRRRDLSVDAIGGLTLGADPIVSAVLVLSYLEREQAKPLSGFLVRKRSKEHGTRRRLEGFQGPPGSRVAVVEDVCTTGGSALQAIQAALQEGYRIAAVLCLVDREQGAAERLRDYPFIPLFTATEILAEPRIQAQLERLRSSFRSTEEN